MTPARGRRRARRAGAGRRGRARGDRRGHAARGDRGRAARRPPRRAARRARLRRRGRPDRARAPRPGRAHRARPRAHRAARRRAARRVGRGPADLAARARAASTGPSSPTCWSAPCAATGVQDAAGAHAAWERLDGLSLRRARRADRARGRPGAVLRAPRRRAPRSCSCCPGAGAAPCCRPRSEADARALRVVRASLAQLASLARAEPALAPDPRGARSAARRAGGLGRAASPAPGARDGRRSAAAARAAGAPAAARPPAGGRLPRRAAPRIRSSATPSAWRSTTPAGCGCACTRTVSTRSAGCSTRRSRARPSG